MKLLLFILLPFQLLAQQSSVIFKNVNIIDVETGKLLEKQHILISGNRIKQISQKTITKKNASVIDATGKYMIPGLWDMHVHVFNNMSNTPPDENNLPFFIANGVCSVRDMWTKPGSLNYVKQWREVVEKQPGSIPRFVSVGTMVDGIPVTWKNTDSVANEQEARLMVRKVRSAGIDFIKVYNKLSKEIYLAIADESKKLNFPFAGHVPESVSMAEASEAGQKSLEHIENLSMFIELSSNEEKFKAMKPSAMTPALRMELIQSVSKDKVAALSALFIKNGTALCPTLVQYRSAMIGDDASVRNETRLKFIDSSERKGWEEYAGRFRPENRPLRQTRFERGLEIVRMMHENGVQILAGTDLGQPFIYPGFSLHDELALFVKAGLSPVAALQTATINPAKFTGREKLSGTISQGKLADLILLDENPLADISNTKKIFAVMINGKLLNIKELEQLTN